MNGTDTAPVCSGCGAELQTLDAARPGYVPASALTRSPAVCQRCFRIKNYNEAATVAVDQDDYLRLLGGIAATRSLVVHIVDVFDFEGSLIGGLGRFVGNNPVLLAVNKVDLLPKAVNLNRIRNWVQQQAKLAGIRTVDVILFSAKRGLGMDKLIDAIERQRSGRDVYVVGATNAGKSTMINRLIRDYSDLDNEVTVSRYPGTTLGEIRIPLEDGASIVDTPGIVYPSRLTELVPRRILGALMPEKPIKPLVYQLNSGQTLFFGALARLDFAEGERQSFTVYAGAGVKVHRTKLERADALYEEHRGELLTPPTRDELADLPAWTRHSLRVPAGAAKDVYISGLGWIAVNGSGGALLDVHAPKGVKVLLRDALI
ncbi:ribosome biogenesis GTPase YqeH [Paenibacillus sp. IB182496]|uniref:Ribosome biogenesis GTPase YqeH n=1 Tax=Paenibacillus sabuli TaxID=2772509 RepID=A0A927BPU1_9BACL|nr:ribosome biogenesis GTPase YqeH [Paenibacillus sabuli]MBD2844496.1 ribosome biogenesis GTPase YqeH [Paenibacillus sabuli]